MKLLLVSIVVTTHVEMAPPVFLDLILTDVNVLLVGLVVFVIAKFHNVKFHILVTMSECWVWVWLVFHMVITADLAVDLLSEAKEKPIQLTL